jgi:hypothetical protein
LHRCLFLMEPKTQITQFLIHLNLNLKLYPFLGIDTCAHHHHHHLTVLRACDAVITTHFTWWLSYLPDSKFQFKFTWPALVKHRNISSKVVHFCGDILVLLRKGIKASRGHNQASRIQLYMLCPKIGEGHKLGNKRFSFSFRGLWCSWMWKRHVDIPFVSFSCILGNNSTKPVVSFHDEKPKLQSPAKSWSPNWCNWKAWIDNIWPQCSTAISWNQSKHGILARFGPL